jgi:hypothetical protein
MSGVTNQSHDWQDQLLEVGSILGNRDRDAIGGYVSNRYVRGKVKKLQESDPFEGVVFSGVNGSEKALTNVDNLDDVIHEAGNHPGDIGSEEVIGSEVGQLQVIYSEENGEEASMSLKREDPFLPVGSNAQETNDNPKGYGSGKRKAAHGDDDHREEDTRTDEEKADDDRKHRNNERVKKGIIWGLLGAATLAVLGGGIAVGSSLLGNNKSNIMNL